MIALYFAVSLLAGALVTAQTGLNARLKEALGHPLPAVIVSSLIGVVLLAAAMMVARTSVPSPSSAIAAPWSAWLGGVLGAATLTALVVTGQLVCSVVLDHFGLLGFELHAASVGRVIGCALLVVGIVLIWRF